MTFCDRPTIEHLCGVTAYGRSYGTSCNRRRRTSRPSEARQSVAKASGVLVLAKKLREDAKKLAKADAAEQQLRTQRDAWSRMAVARAGAGTGLQYQ